MTFNDHELQIRASEEILLAGKPLRRPPAIRPDVIAKLATFSKRHKLLQTEFFREHADALMEVGYALEYMPPPPRESPTPPGGFLRVVSWNIQRGRALDDIKVFLREHETLRHADILLLNEVDLGMARSGNRHIASEIADALHMGYVFGNSYLCLDYGDSRDGPPQGTNGESLHGNAILSRYPFSRAENFTIAITKDKFHSSEKRLGHKKALWAEINTPLGSLAVAAVHLDAYASSAQRAAQLADVLATLERRGVTSRTLIGGDFNTNTYDARSSSEIIQNVMKKLIRGGFPHAMYHYLHPEELYERPVFEALERAGFTYKDLNAPETGTTRYEVGDAESESTVLDKLPPIAVKILRHKLAPWGGVAPLKVDWFAGHGVEAATRPRSDANGDLGSPTPLATENRQDTGAMAGERSGRSRRAPIPPTVIPRPEVQGRRLSDHDPIVLDLRFARDPAPSPERLPTA